MPVYEPAVPYEPESLPTPAPPEAREEWADLDQEIEITPAPPTPAPYPPPRPALEVEEPFRPAPVPAPSDASLFDATEIRVDSPQARDERGLVFGTRQLGGERQYFGDPIDMSLKDADVVETIRSFAQISGLNIVVQPEVQGRVTVELRNVPWDQALEQILKINNLGYEVEGNIMRIAPLSTLREEAQERQQLVAAQSLSVPLETVMKRLSYSSARNIAQLLRRSGAGGVLSQRGSVIVDDRTNTLIISELPEYMDTVLAIIENLDEPEPQVMIEARIIETTKRFSRELGIAWGFDMTAGRRPATRPAIQFPNNVDADGSVNLGTAGRNGLLNLRFGNILNTFQLDLALNAAEEDGLVNILSTPKVATLNNHQATIQSGLQIPIQTVANNTVTVQFVNATLRLEVTPQITADGTVVMDIFIQKREVQTAFLVPGATNAPIATKEAETQVLVRDGGTAVIGGIYEVSTDQSQQRVPGLANIPILGHLFRNRNRVDQNEELLIFITPRVVRL
jgi:type IV pilus secretin PilQ/predicted competence protein